LKFHRLAPCAILLAALLSTFCPSAVPVPDRQPAIVELSRPGAAHELTWLGLDVDFVAASYARVYVSEEEFQKAAANGWPIYWIPNEAREMFRQLTVSGKLSLNPLEDYHDYTELTAELQSLAAAHPSLCQLLSAGKSVQNRDLWVLKISDNVGTEEDEPEFRYIANMHGDETVGREMVIYFARELLNNYGTDATLTGLVNDTEIWLMPSMNPDGFEAGTRYNSSGVDLNRDFPDRIDDPVNTTAGRAAETASVMTFFSARRPVLSANYHGGAQVANYPWDNADQPSGTYAACPDDDIFIYVSQQYANYNTDLLNGGFPGGITNGCDWYILSGGLQDWSYVWGGDMDVTLEISNDKWPAPSLLPTFWSHNRDSMIHYLEQAHSGVRGRVTDAATGAPVAATLTIVGRDMPFYTDPEVGDYHRPLRPGTYGLHAEAEGYLPVTVSNVTVPSGAAVRVDIQMTGTGHTVLQGYTLAEADGNGDAYPDPGETWSMAVTVHNTGAGTAHDVGLSLTAPGSPVQVLAGSYTLGDIAAGGAATTPAPHCRFLILGEADCAEALNFHLDISSAEGPQVADFAEAMGSTIQVNLASADVPKSIPDNNSTGVKSYANIEASGLIQALRLRVDITHPYIGDLWIQLKSPAGTLKVVWDRQGGSADNIHQDFDLTDFNTENMQGSWELWIKDLAGSDIGTLTGWSLLVTTSECNPYPGMTGDLNDDGAITAQDLSLLAHYLAGDLDGAQLLLSRADMDHNGALNAVDLCLLLRSL
jgi:carboxypeptidase D